MSKKKSREPRASSGSAVTPSGTADDPGVRGPVPDPAASSEEPPAVPEPPASSEEPPAVPEPPASSEAAPPAPRGGPDWLTVALVLVVLLNLGLYLYNRIGPGLASARRPSGPPVPPAAPGQPAPPRPGPPVPAGSPGPRNAPQPQVALPSASGDLATLLQTPHGLALLIRLHEEGGAAALSPDQEKRLVVSLKGNSLVRELGSRIGLLQGLLRPAQLKFLRDARSRISSAGPTDHSVVKSAVKDLEELAGRSSPLPLPEESQSVPEFDAVSLALGLQLLAKEGGELALEPPQAAAFRDVLQGVLDAGSTPYEAPAGILTAAQKTWIEENKDQADPLSLLKGRSLDPYQDLLTRMEETFAK